MQETAGKPPTPEEAKLIRQYREEGWNNTEIDQLLGKPKYWTSHIIRDHMRDLIQRTPVGRLLTPQDEQQMMDRLRSGRNIPQIADEFGIARTTVVDRLALRFGKDEVYQYVREHIPFTDEEKQTIKGLYASGVGPTSIAAILSKSAGKTRSGSSVSNFFHRMAEPERTQLRNQHLANRDLKRQPQAATTNVYKAGRIDPGGKGTDWTVGRGYK